MTDINAYICEVMNNRGLNTKFWWWHRMSNLVSAAV